MAPLKPEIALLPDDVINQIAAGEVVENPASAVKELVDNALDAGASRIEIEIQGGGLQMIRVDDDGCGMDRNNAERSLWRHATSKIRKAADLNDLKSMGFRGEALAALASISHLDLRTCDTDQATRICAEGGRVTRIEPCARTQGTTVEVQSLFFNAPARRKFQKSASACTTQVLRLVQALALSHPHVSFQLRSERDVLLKAEPAEWKERIRELLEWDGQWIEENSLHGILGTADKARVNRNGQFVFLNRRPIFSPLISRAVKEGYGTRIAEGQHPSFVLFLEMDPKDFDVNVHPQKREVRFREEGALFSRICSKVRQAFLPDSLPQAAEALAFSSAPFLLREDPVPLPPIEMHQMNLLPESKGRPLAVVGSFLLFEREGSLFAVQLREAYEERVLAVGESQTLLWPLDFSMTVEDEILAHLQAAGIEARRVGAKHLAIDALPKWLHPGDVPSFLSLAKSDGADGIPIRETLRKYCRTVRRRFSMEEAEVLWRQSRLEAEFRIEEKELERIKS